MIPKRDANIRVGRIGSIGGAGLVHSSATSILTFSVATSRLLLLFLFYDGWTFDNPMCSSFLENFIF